MQPHTHVISPDEALDELRRQVRSGRASAQWGRPFPEALTQLLGEPNLPLATWAQLDWYGPIEPWREPQHEVSDILFNGLAHDPLFIVQRGAMTNTNTRLHPSWVRFIQRQLLLRSRRLDPHGDGIWRAAMAQGVADRLRYAITDEAVSPGGPTLALRLLPERWRSLDDLVQGGTIPREAANLLLEGLRCGASILVAGATGSGKTTLTAAITQELGKRHRLVFVEDGGELPHSPNSMAMDVDGEQFALAIRFSLRQRPDYTIVGEVRGGEAMAMLQAAATGHPGIGTIHASDVPTALRNLERLAMLGLAAQSGGGGQAAAQIVRGLITSVNLLVVQIGRTRRGRRSVLAIEEVTRQGAQAQAGEHFVCNRLFALDEPSDQLARAGHVTAEWGRGRVF